jgi:hypothetical protein
VASILDALDIFGGGSSLFIPNKALVQHHTIIGEQIGSDASSGGEVLTQAKEPPTKQRSQSEPPLGHIPWINRPGPFYKKCGPGAFAGDPTDPTDKCCQTHDKCYGEHGLSSKNVNPFQPGEGASPMQQQCDQELCGCIGRMRYGDEPRIGYRIWRISTNSTAAVRWMRRNMGRHLHTGATYSGCIWLPMDIHSQPH